MQVDRPASSWMTNNSSLDKMAAISQTTSSKCIFMNEMLFFSFRLKSFVPSVKLTKNHHWFKHWLGAEQTASHYNDVIMGAIASQITSFTIVNSYRLFRRRSKKTSKLRVTGLCAGNSPGTGEFAAQMASFAENVSIWWRHHAITWTNSDPLHDTYMWHYRWRWVIHHSN